jgi:hypothetical protein
VVDHKITPEGQLRYAKLDLFRIHQEIFMAEGGKAIDDSLGTAAGGVRRMDDAHSHKTPIHRNGWCFKLDEDIREVNGITGYRVLGLGYRVKRY